MRFGKKRVVEPPPVETKPAPVEPRLEITTSMTAKIVGRNFEIEPRDSSGNVWIRYTHRERYAMYDFRSLLIPAAFIPELRALLGEAARVNLDPPSKVTRMLNEEPDHAS